MDIEKKKKLKAFLNAIPLKDREKKLTEDISEVSAKTSTNITEIDRAELDKIMCVEMVIIQSIAAKNGISPDRMAYDLASSYYANNDTTNKDFKFPSDTQSDSIENLIDLGKTSEYQRNIPKDIEIDEGQQGDFKNKLLEAFGQKEDRLLELLNKLNKKPT